MFRTNTTYTRRHTSHLHSSLPSRYIPIFEDQHEKSIYPGRTRSSPVAGKSRLKVELCEKCGSFTDNISKLCRQLEKLKIEIESGLESIHGKMLKADETGRAEQFRGMMCSKLDSGMGGGMEIMEALRMETMHKCSLKINVTSPRLKIHKLTSEEIRRKSLRTSKNIITTNLERLTDSGLEPNSFKTEEPDIVGVWSIEDNKHSETSFCKEWEGNADDSMSTVEQEDVIAPDAMGGPSNMGQGYRKEGISTGSNSKLKLVINPETGKYNCQLCSMEYAASSGLYYHHSTVHRRIRIKCKICGKEFTQEGGYKIHHQSVHLGIRFQCQGCKKTFAEKRSLRKHQRKSGCAIKVYQNIQ